MVRGTLCRRINGGYQRAGDRRGSQQWARSHRTGALHNSVGGYARTRKLNPRRAEANFRQHRQDSVEPSWSPKKRNRTHRVGTNNSQKQDGCPSKDLTLRELSVSLSELYDKLKGKLSKSFPMKPDTEGRRDKSKKCKYHNDFGHTLNNCYTFKKEISRMVDGGQLKEYLKGSQKLAHVNLIEHDVIIVDRASSESKDPVDAEDRQTLASLCKQLKRKHPTFNDSDQGMNLGNLGSIGGEHEDTGGDIIPTESEKSESEAETLDDLEIRDLEILALEKSDWRLPFIEYMNSGNLPIEKALSQKVVTSTTPSACGCSLEPRITIGEGRIEVDLEMAAQGECKPELQDLKLGSGCLVVIGGTLSSSEE
ncbi:hypothetical protein IFM89_012028 [Coptis chinensis]|uniref:Uncharacterized protein n=1 Tax=Coptis chinensis TaxID=261450 RepID=A0A835IW30_9MAGN|nr:hypothetical protein IFM89_012028 [Coptis chinensis]